MSTHPNHQRADALRALKVGDSYVEEINRQTGSFQSFRNAVYSLGMREGLALKTKQGENGEFIAIRLKRKK